MNKHPVVPLTLLLILSLSTSHAFAQADFGEFETIDEPSREALATPPQDMPQPSRPAFTQAELDQMLAPIALYPDSLLSQILMAATYPLEVIEASRWSTAHPDIKGEQAVAAVSEFSWDPSVKALAAFPQVLAVMDEKLAWMEQLGDAFLSQREQVMDTVQSLRQKAAEAGNLESDDHQQVTYTESNIIITSVDPSLVYVPYYNPMVIYGTWWWPAYAPVYWAPWRGYYAGSGFYSGFTWGLGTPIAGSWFWSGFNWPAYQIFVRNNHVWRHNSFHRRGIPYQNRALHREFGRTSASSGFREHSREFETPAFGGHSGFNHRPDMRFGSHERHRQPGSAQHHKPSAGTHSWAPRDSGGRHHSPSYKPQSMAPHSAQRPFHTPSQSQGRHFAPSSGFSGTGGFQAGSHFRGGGSMHSGGFRSGGGGMHRGGASHGGGGGHRR